jgi:hypothetical protein
LKAISSLLFFTNGGYHSKNGIKIIYRIDSYEQNNNFCFSLIDDIFSKALICALVALKEGIHHVEKKKD